MPKSNVSGRCFFTNDRKKNDDNHFGLHSILFDQSLLHKYSIIEVGSDSKLWGLFWSFPSHNHFWGVIYSNVYLHIIPTFDTSK